MSFLNKKLFVIVSILVVVSLIFIFSQDSKITNYPSSGRDVVAFGDSLVVGVGASQYSNSFVGRLSRLTGENIINLGVSGNTTRDALSRLSDLDRYNPKVVLVLLGGNDYLRKIPQEETFQNLEKIIQNIHSRGAVVVLLGVRGGLLSDKFENDFEDLADKLGTAYVPNVLDGLITDGRYMSDAIHPNDLGYEKIAEKIYPSLIKVLE